MIFTYMGAVGSRPLGGKLARAAVAVMVKNCCVVGCANYVAKKGGLSFFRFPLTDRNRCQKWEAAIRREGWHPVKSSRICNEHFLNGMEVVNSS